MLGSLLHFKMILLKPRSLMKPTRNEMEYAVGPFRSQHVAPVWPYLLSRQTRIGNVSAFSCVRKPQWKATIGVVLSLSSTSNSSIRCCPPTPRPSTQSHTNSCRQHVLNLHVLVSLLVGFCHISIQSFRWTYERTALPSPFPDC